jgi:hypothetical protein
VEGNAKHFKPTPKASQGSLSRINESISVSSDHTTDVVSEASDDCSVASARTTSTPNEDPLQNAIIRTLPCVQPGLFTKEICDQLSAEYQEYRSSGSFKTMIHHNLTVMVDQKKLERQSATTQMKGRSHRYIRVRQQGFDKSQSTEGGEAKISDVDVADSYSKVSTTFPDAGSHTYREVPSRAAVPAIPAPAQRARSPHTLSVARAVESPNKQTHPCPTKIDSEPSPSVLEAQTTANGHQSTHVTSKASDTQIRDIALERGEHTQPQTSKPAPSLPQRLSSPPSAEAQGMQLLRDIPEHNSGRQGLSSRADADDHQTVPTPSPQGTQKIQVDRSDAKREPPAKSPLPLHSGPLDVATTSASSNDTSTELPRSCVDQESLTKTSVLRPSPPSTNEGESGQRRASHGRSSISDNLSGIHEQNTTSLLPGTPSGNVSMQGQMANFVSYVPKSQTGAVAHQQIGRGYSAQGWTHATTTGGKQNPTPLLDASACSEGITFPHSQGQPSFTAINPKRRSEVPMSTLSAGTWTAVISASGVTHNKASRPAHAYSSNAEAKRSDTSKRPNPQVRPEVLGTPHSSVQTPKQQSGSGSVQVQQRAVECPEAKGSQLMLTSEQQAKQSPGVAVSEKNQQNSNSARLIGPNSAMSIIQAQQMATMDPTNIFDALEEPSDTTRRRAGNEDHSALELLKLANEVREVGRRRYADEAKSFDLKLENAESILDKLLEEMKAHMEKFNSLHGNLELLHNQVAEQEDQVEAIRRQADQTRDTANMVTLECRALTESKRKAEKVFANTEKELDRLVQALGTL